MDEQNEVLSNLANDLSRFAHLLESGPSGWQIMPLLTTAAKQMLDLPPERHERLGGALFAIVYGIEIEPTKNNVVAEVRRVAERLREVLEPV